MAALFPHCRLGGLRQNPPYKTIPFRRPSTMILLGAHMGSRADTRPGTKLPGRGERLGILSHFGDDLLRRLGSESVYPSHSGYGVLVRVQLLRQQLVQILDLLTKAFQTF